MLVMATITFNDLPKVSSGASSLTLIMQPLAPLQKLPNLRWSAIYGITCNVSWGLPPKKSKLSEGIWSAAVQFSHKVHVGQSAAKVG